VKTFQKIYGDFVELCPRSHVKAALLSVLRTALNKKNPYLKYIQENGHTYVWYSHDLITKHSRFTRETRCIKYTRKCLKDLQEAGFIDVIRNGPRRYIRLVEDVVEKALRVLRGLVDVVEQAVETVCEATQTIVQNVAESARGAFLKASTYLENLKTMTYDPSKPLPPASNFKTFEQKMKNPKYACKVEIDKTDRPKTERDILKKLVDLSVSLAQEHKNMEIVFYDKNQERWQNSDFLEPCPDKGLTIIYKGDGQKEAFLRYSAIFNKIGIYLHKNSPSPIPSSVLPEKVINTYKNPFSETVEAEKPLDLSDVPDEYRELVKKVSDVDKIAGVWLKKYGLGVFDKSIEPWKSRLFDDYFPETGITILTFDEHAYSLVKRHKKLYEGYGIYLWREKS
jgi:hypothetical protein